MRFPINSQCPTTSPLHNDIDRPINLLDDLHVGLVILVEVEMELYFYHAYLAQNDAVLLMEIRLNDKEVRMIEANPTCTIRWRLILMNMVD